MEMHEIRQEGTDELGVLIRYMDEGYLTPKQFKEEMERRDVRRDRETGKKIAEAILREINGMLRVAEKGSKEETMLSLLGRWIGAKYGAESGCVKKF